MKILRSSAAVVALCFPIVAQAQTTETLGSTGQGLSFSTVQPVLGLTPLIQIAGNFNNVGHVKWFGGNFAPPGHVIADGASLSIIDNQTLFSRLGYTYGGSFDSGTFKLPDLRGRVVVGSGDNFAHGTKVGQERVTLTEANLPGHTHTAEFPTETVTSTAVGSGTAYENMMPGLALNHEIITGGTFPSRSIVGAPLEGADTARIIDADSGTLAFISIDAGIPGGSGTPEPVGASADTPGFASISLESDRRKADGTTTEILANTALFSLLGTIYGGNGRTDFDLPDVENRVVTGTGSGPGLTDRRVGETRGVNLETLTLAELPNHIHTSTSGAIISATGGNIFENNLQEELSMNWLVSIVGAFPSSGGTSVIEGEPMLGEISLFAGNFAPRGYALANGQILPISQFSALFSLFGTSFGGDGEVTFALPDLRGRTPIGVGQLDGTGTNYRLGSKTGFESAFLTDGNLPAHSHDIIVPPAPVPLPSSVWMLLAALGSLGAMRLRRAA